MQAKPDSKKRSKPRQIVGFSLPPDLVAEVKVEAARRNISLRTLFIEMWTTYRKKMPSNDR